VRNILARAGGWLVALALSAFATCAPAFGQPTGKSEHADAALVFVHVAESAASRWLGEESLDQETRDDQVALEQLAREFAERGTRTSVRLGHGDATREIARAVREEDADLLITGSHGHKGLSDVVFGATVSGVRHLVRCPILTVPPLRRH